jgi:hypothetical protein
MPVKAGSSMARANGSSRAFAAPAASSSSSSSLPGSAAVTRALATQRMSRSRSADSSRPLESPPPAQPQVADVGLGGDVGERHAVAQPAPAQVGVDDHRELVGGAEAAGAGCGADHHRAGPFQQGLVGLPGFLSVAAGADRMGVASARPQARHLVEGQPRAGGDHQVVVGQALAVAQAQAVLCGQHALRRDADEADAVTPHRLLQRDADRLRPAPADRDQRVGRRELEVRTIADQGHLVRRPQGRLDFVGGCRAAESRAQDHILCHGASSSPLSGWAVACDGV